MGDFNVRSIINDEERTQMYKSAINDIQAFEKMISDGQFDSGPPKIGAEQELCLVDEAMNPAPTGLKVLDEINDDHYTNELALFNLEINLDPESLRSSCFQRMESALIHLLDKGRPIAEKHGSKIVMAGILPSLKYRHLQFENMTPVDRYKTISQSLFDLRGRDFEIYLQGADEIIMSLGTVLFEACNTSFQLHLQINPAEFVNKHNWSQMISGPVLSACVNSPLLFGNELWEETRIALFKQSLDTRSSQKFLRKKLPRVYFGNDWLRNSPSELWKNDLMRFPVLLTSDNLQDSVQLLNDGQIPSLRAIRLHNGTTYTWNRMCYGFDQQNPHLRIECRYLPSGPSAIDEIANQAFWTGLMLAQPRGGEEFWRKVDFKEAKNNFIKAARTGLSTVFKWYGTTITAKDLILNELLPLAKKGLEQVGINTNEISKYLNIFENRVRTENTGSAWMIRNYRALNEKYGSSVAEVEIVRQMIRYQEENIPVCDWLDLIDHFKPSGQEYSSVESIMSTDIYALNENSCVDVIQSTLKWNNFHHLPIENDDGDLSGLVTDGMLERIDFSNKDLLAKDVMMKDFITIEAHDTVSKAVDLMKTNKISGLPVINERKLVGMITVHDLDKLKVLDTK